MRFSLPRVSVLLPVRNEAPRLARALRSLQRQRLTDWECVIVDDGSTDGSRQIAERFAQADERFVVSAQAHGGLVSALNRGLEQCRAPVVARMDGDDACHRDRLAAQLDWLSAHPDIDVVSCLVRLFPRRVLRVGLLRYEAWLNSLITPERIAADFFVESPVAHPSVMMRRAALIAAGGYIDNGWPEDYDLFLRLHLRGARFAKVPQTLFFWCERAERYTRTSPVCSVDAIIRCKLAHLRAQVPGAVALRGGGPTGRQLMRRMRTLGWDVQRIVDVDPDRIGQRIDGIPVVSTDDETARRLPLLVAVGVAGAREQIRAELSAQGRVEGRDHWFLA